MSITIRRSLLIAALAALTLAALVLGGGTHLVHVAAMSFSSAPGMNFS